MKVIGSEHQPQDGEGYKAKRCQILDGARRVFMDLGFDGASMGEIAKAANVSKGTLYAYFDCKNSLFEMTVENEFYEQGIAKLTVNSEEDIGTTLRKFGRSYLKLLCDPYGGSTIRTVMVIAERMPELGRRYYENVPAAWIRKLADYLRIQVQMGHTIIDDCDLAAAQFMLSCQATLFLPFIFQVKPAPSNEEIAAVVDSATCMILAAYCSNDQEPQDGSRHI